MFSATFKLLQNEAFLTQGELSAGLTALRNAAHPDKAKFYSGFFSTAVAFERLMKLIVIVDHMLSHSYAAPTKAQLKAYGHNLVQLHATCVAIAKKRKVSTLVSPTPRTPEGEILAFLSDFATVSRYHNLDMLGASSALQPDPLARWDTILMAVLNADGSPATVQRLKAQSAAMAKVLAGSVSAIQHGMDGRHLSLQEVILQPSIHRLASGYMMVRLFALLAPLLKLVGKLGHEAFYGSPTDVVHVPNLSEFFVYFSGTPAEIRKKKRWP